MSAAILKEDVDIHSVVCLGEVEDRCPTMFWRMAESVEMIACRERTAGWNPCWEGCMGSCGRTSKEGASSIVFRMCERRHSGL